MWKLILLSVTLVSLAYEGQTLAIDVDEHEVDNGLDSNSTSVDTDLEPRQVTLLVNNKMYYVIYTQLNWHSAAEYCSSQNLILASISNSGENEKLFQQLRENGLLNGGSNFWLGASDLGHNGQWFWLSNGRPLLYRNWSPGEPNNYGGVQHCMQLLNNGKWDDMNCERTNGVICENRCSLDSYNAPLYPPLLV